MTDALVPRLLALLQKEEGVRLQVYDDFSGRPIVPGSIVVGHPTVGCGRALDVNGISDVEVLVLLQNDIEKIFSQLDTALPWWRTMTVPRQCVLSAMVFQLGIGGTMAFRATLRAMELGNYEQAAAGMLASKWARQTPARVGRMADIMRGA